MASEATLTLPQYHRIVKFKASTKDEPDHYYYAPHVITDTGNVKCYSALPVAQVTSNTPQGCIDQLRAILEELEKAEVLIEDEVD